MLNSKVKRLELEVYDFKKKMKLEIGYDSDLVIDQADEARLDKLNELEREKELDERRKKRQILLDRYQLIKQKQSQIQKSRNQFASDSDSSDSSSDSSDSSDFALANLKNQKRQSEVSIVKPHLLTEKQNPDQATVNEYRKIQLSRETIVDQINSPFL